MKWTSNLLLALCISLFILMQLTYAKEANDPEINQIVASAQRHVQSRIPNVNVAKRVNYVFIKRVGDCALVNSVPKPGIEGEIEGIILKKISGKWVVKFEGTDIVPMKEICPDLFK